MVLELIVGLTLPTWLFLPALVLLLPLAFGCSAATPTPEPTVDPQSVLDRAANRIRSLRSGSFNLEHRQGSTVLMPGLVMKRVYGEADIPDKFRFTVEAESNGQYVEIQMLVFQDQAFMSNFLTGRWQSVPLAAIPFQFSDLGQTLAGLIESVQQPVLASTERVKGRDAFRMRGQVGSADLVNLVPGASAGSAVTLELWVDRTENLLLQVLITGPVVPSDAPDTVRMLTLDNIDGPVNIAPPEQPGLGTR